MALPGVNPETWTIQLPLVGMVTVKDCKGETREDAVQRLLIPDAREAIVNTLKIEETNPRVHVAEFDLVGMVVEIMGYRAATRSRVPVHRLWACELADDHPIVVGHMPINEPEVEE